MKTITLKLTYAVLVSLFFMSCTSEDDGLYEESAFQDVSLSYSVIEYQISSLVNEHRESIGLVPLEMINVVSKEAEGHTKYMITVGEPSHDNFDVRYKRLVDKVSAKTVGENVAYGYSTAESVVAAWLKSPDHRRTIENSEYDSFGISTKQNEEGRNYFTNIFVKR